MTVPGTIPMPLLTVLARGGFPGDKVADVICRLVLEGAALGELQDVIITVAGEPRVIKMMPQLWLDRLNLAVERGAMERMETPRIVERLLMPPEVA
jgi:hypothetical protein